MADSSAGADRPTESDEKLARALIRDAFEGMVRDAVDDLARQEAAAASARRALEQLRGRREAWLKSGTFDHVVGFRAVAMAQSADMAETDLPPGVHLRALAAYLNEHHPA